MQVPHSTPPYRFFRKLVPHFAPNFQEAGSALRTSAPFLKNSCSAPPHHLCDQLQKTHFEEFCAFRNCLKLLKHIHTTITHDVIIPILTNGYTKKTFLTINSAKIFEITYVCGAEVRNLFFEVPQLNSASVFFKPVSHTQFRSEEPVPLDAEHGAEVSTSGCDQRWARYSIF